jgi:hypothetical protein
MEGEDIMGDYETPAAEVWSNSTEPSPMSTSDIGGGGVVLPDTPFWQ